MWLLFIVWGMVVLLVVIVLVVGCNIIIDGRLVVLLGLGFIELIFLMFRLIIVLLGIIVLMLLMILVSLIVLVGVILFLFDFNGYVFIEIKFGMMCC